MKEEGTYGVEERGERDERGKKEGMGRREERGGKSAIGFYHCLAAAMASGLERMKTIDMSQEEITCYVRTYRLIEAADSRLIHMAFTPSTTTASSLPHNGVQCAAFCMLRAACTSSSLSPELSDLADSIAQAALDLSLPLIAPSYHSPSATSTHSSTVTNISSSSSSLVSTTHAHNTAAIPLIAVSSPTSSSTLSSATSAMVADNQNENAIRDRGGEGEDILEASLKSWTIIVLLLGGNGSGSGLGSGLELGSVLLEKFSPLLVRTILGESGTAFALHGTGFAKCVTLAGIRTRSNALPIGMNSEGYTVLLKLSGMIISAVLADQLGEKSIPKEIAAQVVCCFEPVFCPFLDFGIGGGGVGTKTGSGNRVKNGSEGNGEIECGYGDVLLQLLELNSLLPGSQSKTLHSTLLPHSILCLKKSAESSLECVISALKYLPYVLTGYAATSPRPCLLFQEDQATYDEVRHVVMFVFCYYC